MKRFCLISAVSIMAFFAVSCGQGSNNNPSCAAGQSVINGTCQYSNYNAAAYQGTCTPGMIQTSYGCLSQGACTIGTASYNGQCVPAIAGGINGTQSCQGSCINQPGTVQTTMGCLPQGACSPCMGSYNGQCVPSTAINTGGLTSPFQNTGINGYPTNYPTTGYPSTMGYPTAPYMPMSPGFYIYYY